jgi:hypothetical protein
MLETASGNASSPLAVGRTSTPRVVTPCTQGGTLDRNTTDTGFTELHQGCREHIDRNGDGTLDSERFTDGAITLVRDSALRFTFTRSNFTERVTRLANGRLRAESGHNFTAAGTITATLPCAGTVLPSAFTVVLNGTLTLKTDEDGDGLLDRDIGLQTEGFSITAQVNTLDERCQPVALVASETGRLAITDHLDARQSSVLDIPSQTPLVLTLFPSQEPRGRGVTVQGSFMQTSACFMGTLTLATPTPLVFPSVPDSAETDLEFANCPTAGVLTVTGDQIGAITFTSTGAVQIDNGSDGTIDEVIQTCGEAEVCP